MGRNKQPRQPKIKTTVEQSSPATASAPLTKSQEVAPTSWWSAPSPWPRWLAFIIFLVPTAISLFGLWLNYKPTRARLAAIGASLEGRLTVDLPLKVILDLENIGDDDAYDVISAATTGITLPFTAAGAAIEQELGPFGGSAVDSCQELEPRGGYPTIYRGKPGRIYAGVAFTASDSIIKGERTFFVSGCTAYRSGWSKERHTTSFCFFLSSHRDSATGERLFLPCRGNFRHT